MFLQIAFSISAFSIQIWRVLSLWLSQPAGRFLMIYHAALLKLFHWDHSSQGQKLLNWIRMTKPLGANINNFSNRIPVTFCPASRNTFTFCQFQGSKGPIAICQFLSQMPQNTSVFKKGLNILQRQLDVIFCTEPFVGGTEVGICSNSCNIMLIHLLDKPIYVWYPLNIHPKAVEQPFFALPQVDLC